MGRIVGQCKQCGMCCVLAECYHYEANVEKLQLRIRQNIDFNSFRIPKEPFNQCKELQFDADTGLARCKIQNHKSQICADFPTEAAELVIPGCGFHWVED